MGKLFKIYTIIGLLLTPFIYINTGAGYMYDKKSEAIGSSLGGAFYWPSYLFSIEPEIDGSSYDNFSKSLKLIVKYRNDTLFNGQGTIFKNFGYDKFVYSVMLCSISKSPLLDNADNIIDSLYFTKLMENNLLKSDNSTSLDKIVNDNLIKTMERMDGYDFADLLECGQDFKDRVLEDIVSASPDIVKDPNVRAQLNIFNRI